MTTHRQRKQRDALLAGALLIVALLPRLWAIGRTVTPDELTWVYRSIRFREAVLTGQWAATVTAGHPGATTTWLGALGISLQLLIQPAARTTYTWLTHLAWISPDLTAALARLATFLTAGRLLVALATSLGIVGMHRATRPLLGRRTALVAALLLALDPFYAGLSGLLHVDGLATTLATLSLLVLLGSKKRSHDAAAGALAALTVLTKSPLLLLLPFSGLVLLAQSADLRERRLDWRSLLGRGLVWGLALLATGLVVLPALWADPAGVFDIMFRTANRHATDALRPTFFMGEASLEHGPLYYPVILLFRLSPLAWIGLLLGLAHIRRGAGRQRPAVVALLSWAAIYLLVITLAAKKFDRYVLPAVPALTLCAAAGWTGLEARATRGRWRWPIQHAGSLAIVLQVILLLSVLPYPLVAYNPLAGGGRAAEKVMSVGWGSGSSAAARWLAQQPDAEEVAVASSDPLALASFFPGRILPFDEINIARADYLILDAASRQLDPQAFDEITAGAVLTHTVRANGLALAWVYWQPEPQAPSPPLENLPQPYTFGQRVQLLGIQAEANDRTVWLRVRWGLAQPGGRYVAQIVLRDEWDHAWGRLETPLLNDVLFYPEHWTEGETPEVQHTLELPAGIPPADYRIELSLFDKASGERLPLLDSAGNFDGVFYTLTPVAIPAPDEPLALTGLYLPVPVNAGWENGTLTLLGYDPPASSVTAGDKLDWELFWLPQERLPAGLTLQVTLGDGQTTSLPISRAPSESWLADGLLNEKYSIQVPPRQPAGVVALSIRPARADGAPLDGPSVSLGMVEIETTDRLFELPENIGVPLDYRLGRSLHLRGLTLETPEARPGEPVRLTLYWQTDTQPDDTFTAFVHLVAPNSSTPAQDDRWPGLTPSNTWAAGQVIVDTYDITLPADAPPGTYQLFTGLYRAADGTRLTAMGPDGAPVPDDRILLPVSVDVHE